MPHDIIWRLLLSVIVGGALGAEREYRSKSAGFRTLTLICLGAALFTCLSEWIGGPRNTPDRIASNVVVGIGFVGAGVIFKGDGHDKVSGITTAAMIWVTAALGMGIGSGHAWVSIFGCLLTLGVLLLFSVLEGWIDRINQIRNYKIVCDFRNETLYRYEEQFREHHLKFRRIRQIRGADDLITGEWVVQGSEKSHRHFVRGILMDPTIKSFEF